MEDTLRAGSERGARALLKVLILVLMEDTLRGLIELLCNKFEIVLILVLMEDTLRDKKKFGSKIQKPS